MKIYFADRKGKNGKDKGKGAGNKGTIRGFKLVWSDLRLGPEEWIIWVEYSIQCISDLICEDILCWPEKLRSAQTGNLRQSCKNDSRFFWM